ncbi:Tubulin polyglutamylase TTLL11 [Intoshia linei]|uniref:Tubulin polyglutamylase TTLL11 n=1 Tax=Intoshia linei TaxID=1819745 RepID=A0A177AYX9_9BILA|nr:Tubulin polyglutamylase TTLL11 [Intoshia linei]
MKNPKLRIKSGNDTARFDNYIMNDNRTSSGTRFGRHGEKPTHITNNNKGDEYESGNIWEGRPRTKTLKSKYQTQNCEYKTESRLSKKIKNKNNDKIKKHKKSNKHVITANISGSRYEIIKTVMQDNEFQFSNETDCDIFWFDGAMSIDKLNDLKSFQKINHFPAMNEISRKDNLARNISRMIKYNKDEFSFIPKTWIFPADYSSFQNYVKLNKKKRRYFITKPLNGAMGNGIKLTKNIDRHQYNDGGIVQEYIEKPFLVDGYKCDLRLYVMITSCDPLRIFLYNDGLLRLSTEKYSPPNESNMDSVYMHLTNYSINRHSENYNRSSSMETGSKRSLLFFNKYLMKQGYDNKAVWRNISDLIVKTMILVHPHLFHAYRLYRPCQSPELDSVCFEILGFDIILDRKLTPWLLEVNRSPSFNVDEKLDNVIKYGLIEDALKLIRMKHFDKRKEMATQKALIQKRLFKHQKRYNNEIHDRLDKAKEARRNDLQDLLIRIRKDAERDEWELENSGRFTRIFPPNDRFKKEKYTNLIIQVFKIFFHGRSKGLQNEIERIYSNSLSEEDLVEMLSKFDEENKIGKKNIKFKNHFDNFTHPKISTPSISRAHALRSIYINENRLKKFKSMVMTKNYTNSFKYKFADNADCEQSVSVNKGKHEIYKSLLCELNKFQIKFPGKTDQDAQKILQNIYTNWKFHKSRVASYWLVKLDNFRRKKILSIVNSNINSLLYSTTPPQSIEFNRLSRIFERLFCQLSSAKGHGLWDCFKITGSSWEVIFGKTSDNLSTIELNICRRIVQLCRDCLLIVYQFATQTLDDNNTSNHSFITVRRQKLEPNFNEKSTDYYLY